MPSKNSINKPSAKLDARLHERRLIKKRAEKAKKDASLKRTHDPKSLASLTEEPKGTGVMTQILSKKRIRRLERNARFTAKRNQQLEHDLAVQQEGMDVELTLPKREKKQKPETHLEKVRKVLWTAVEDSVASSMPVDTSGEGTTIGIQAF